MRIPLLSQSKPSVQADAMAMAKLPGPQPGNAAARGFGAAFLAWTLGSWGVSQLGAKMEHFAPMLPGHINGRLWYPWALFDGWGHIFSGGQYFLLMSLETVTVAASIGIGVGVYAVKESKARQRHAKKKLDIHGSSGWATFDEVRKANLIGDGEGVYLGTLMNPDDGQLYPIRHNGPEHILVSAPTRSGKGVAIIIPTLYSWLQSAVIYDMKAELWALTSAIRQAMGQRVLKYNPSSRDSVHFNPLDEIDIFSDAAVADAQNVALMMVDNDGVGLDDHWKQKAHEVITAAILYILLPKQSQPDHYIPSLGDVADFLTDVQDETAAKKKDILVKLIRCKGAIRSEYVDHPAIKGAAHFCSHVGAQLHEIEDRELSSIFSTTIARLTLFFDPIVRANTSDSHFRLKDLMGLKAGDPVSPVSLYMTIPQKEKDRLKPLIRLIFTMIVRHLAENLEFAGGRGQNPYQHRLLLLIDEFPSLGRMAIIEEALAYMAGYGIKTLLVIQDRQQLIKSYTVHESVTAGCHIRAAFAPNTLETAKWLSDMAGVTTVYHRTESLSGKKTNIYGLEHLNQADQYYSRALITPDEVMRIPSPEKVKQSDGEERIVAPGAELLLVSGQKPIFARQELYFLHQEYVDAINQLPLPPSFDDSWKIRYRTLPHEEVEAIHEDQDVEVSNVMRNFSDFSAFTSGNIRQLPSGRIKVKKEQDMTIQEQPAENLPECETAEPDTTEAAKRQATNAATSFVEAHQKMPDKSAGLPQDMDSIADQMSAKYKGLS